MIFNGEEIPAPFEHHLSGNIVYWKDKHNGSGYSVPFPVRSVDFSVVAADSGPPDDCLWGECDVVYDSFDVALEDFSYEDFEGTTHEVRNAAFTVEPAPFRARSRLPEGVTLYFRGELDGTPFANADGGIQAGTGSDPNAQLSVNQGDLLT